MTFKSDTSVTDTDPEMGGRFVLGSEVVLGGVAELRARLEMSMAGGAPVDLDASTVRRIDTAGLQLLVAFHHEMSRRGQRVTLHQPSPAFRESLETSGLVEVWSDAMNGGSSG